MSEDDPLRTQRSMGSTITFELEAAGFGNAQEIGRGGFGVVYRCVQNELDRTVAVKILTADLDAENRARFFREQRAMARLTGHPNIVTVLQVGSTDNGRPYIVMPYHPQGSLEARIRRQGPLALNEALRLGVKIAGAVESAHRLGILHRDIKPGNILLTDYQEPALSDFGIAHISGGFETATGSVTGSPAFTAPEVLRGDPPTPSSDVYSVGATLFCVLTGHAAFERRSGEQIVAQFLRIATNPIPDLSGHGISDDISKTIARAMSRDPHERPSAKQLGNELRGTQLRHGHQVDDMALRAEPVSEPHGPVPMSHAHSAQSGRGTKGNIPLELTSFVGRRRELTEAKTLLRSSRLVTLTGIGGVGKTRLALKVANNVHRAFADGVWFVELGELREESLLVDVVSGALGIRDQMAIPRQEALIEFLSSRELMLVLDNCEQLVGGVAELAESLLRTCPGVRILTTSREPLGIGGEVALRVPPLSVPDPDRDPSLQGLPSYDAVTLFADRAATALPGFELTDDNRMAVTRICQHLDGLPLPLELAAARLQAMSPEQILQRLTDRYALLTRGSRTAPTRQQTLRLCIDWSHELCTPLEQLVWARLSVFAGGVELDAAESVCGMNLTAEALLDAITSLVEKSILIREERDDVVRFRLLETLREYGRTRSEQTEELPELIRRHSDWYLQLALNAEAEWIGPRQLEWIARLEREQSNLRETLNYYLSEDPDTGLRISNAMHLFWSSRGLCSEGRYWLDHFLARQSGQPTIDRVKALYSVSALADWQGDLSSAAAAVAEARVLAEQMTDPLPRALAVHADGVLKVFAGDYTRAPTLLAEALEVFREQNRIYFQVEALIMLGLSNVLCGETAQSMAYYQEALDITDTQGESVNSAFARWGMAVAVWQQGDRARATDLLQQALIRIARRVQDPVGSAACLDALAWIAGDAREAHRAAVLMGAAESLAHVVGTSPVLLPGLLVHHEECVQTCRRTLTDKTFMTAVEEGRQLGLEAAVAYAVGERVPAAPSPSTGDTTVTLTKRERQVAELIAEGLTNKAIADQLVISPRTAQGHVEHILTKLGFHTRAQIAAWIAEQQQHS
ncbi:protein kinase [Rhodococcus sp. IEGM 1307]|uniref:protein kinase domain-containing protein n=1 Tax=Rhodococcus sp. IEGM 1307 TaxID=3047091 RepID=UPI0024B8634F|nr:protein kinase [Rhodococcus sp. IEGM 1307]MDI9977353.1 protein kinase [Rhodococcus sp. IEGM 1307]